jgi:hypothetical protein
MEYRCRRISMSSWAEPFRQRLQLLTDLLPVIAREPRFALKGGTAINLFEHDLPRLSVDIDLTWLPVGSFADDRRDMSAALERIAEALRQPPLRLHVATTATGTQGLTRLIASRPGARVQIETTPVMRGTVHPVRMMTVQARVQAAFGFAEMQVLHFADLYGGKLAAALSRQHPRDLFDIGLLLGSGSLDAPLWRTFLVYLTASPKPAAELLQPGEPRDLATAFRTQFEGMTATPVTVEALLATRTRLLQRIPELMDDAARAFLVSVEREAPDFSLIGLPHAAELPGVRRKLRNLGQRTPAKREADYRQLAGTLARIALR